MSDVKSPAPGKLSSKQASCACGWKGPIRQGPLAEKLAKEDAVDHLAHCART